MCESFIPRKIPAIRYSFGEQKPFPGNNNYSVQLSGIEQKKETVIATRKLRSTGTSI